MEAGDSGPETETSRPEVSSSNHGRRRLRRTEETPYGHLLILILVAEFALIGDPRSDPIAFKASFLTWLCLSSLKGRMHERWHLFFCCGSSLKFCRIRQRFATNHRGHSLTLDVDQEAQPGRFVYLLPAFSSLFPPPLLFFFFSLQRNRQKRSASSSVSSKG